TYMRLQRRCSPYPSPLRTSPVFLFTYSPPPQPPPPSPTRRSSDLAQRRGAAARDVERRARWGRRSAAPQEPPLRAEPLRRDCHRSEEHTSELQSLTNLVCRLLLEKKKKHNHITDRDNTTTALIYAL